MGIKKLFIHMPFSFQCLLLKSSKLVTIIILIIGEYLFRFTNNLYNFFLHHCIPFLTSGFNFVLIK